MEDKKPARKKVLIIEDSKFTRERLSQILENLDFEIVATAEDGPTGISCFREYKPDIVTIDMVMPGYLKGIDCLRLLKQIDPNVAVVMVTSVSNEKSVRGCIEEGARHYILKPFNEKKIEDVMKKIALPYPNG
jgi:two-component system chemotaxis response regulator CheY